MFISNIFLNRILNVDVYKMCMNIDYLFQKIYAN